MLNIVFVLTFVCSIKNYLFNVSAHEKNNNNRKSARVVILFPSSFKIISNVMKQKSICDILWEWCSFHLIRCISNERRKRRRKIGTGKRTFQFVD